MDFLSGGGSRATWDGPWGLAAEAIAKEVGVDLLGKAEDVHVHIIGMAARAE